MEHFPERASWALMGVHFSNKQNTNRRVNLQKYVVGEMRKDQVGGRYEKPMKAFDAAQAMTECINNIAELQVKQGEKQLRFHSLECARVFTRRLPLCIVVPTQEQLGLQLS